MILGSAFEAQNAEFLTVNIVITPFEPVMTGAVIRLWNRCIGAQYPMTERLFQQQVLDDPFRQRDGNLVALDGDRIVGWVLSRCLTAVPPSLQRYARQGSIGALCVHPDHRGDGIGSRLYQAAETFLISQGAATITLVRYPYHLVPGVPSEAPDLRAFFAHRGFQEWREAYDLRSSLSDFPTAQSEVAAWQGAGMRAVLRLGRRSEQDGIMEFLHGEFPGGWEFEIGRYLETGGDPSEIALAVACTTILGFCRIHTPESPRLGGSTHWFPLLRGRWGGLGPIGIAAAWRERGLGTALLHHGLSVLKRKGIEDAVIDWTALEAWYGRAGFQVWKRYWFASKAKSHTAEAPTESNLRR